jgi:glycosyltransferase involved in cell wall biosynthesis
MEPIISVKIPTYNCANYLIQTIASVLNQKNFNIDLLEIEVIDDCSTIDNPEEVVNKYGLGKVKFHRQQKNVGAVKNFNTCIERSKCKYLHILHGDDYVEDGFYSAMYELLVNQDAVIFSSRCYIVNEKSKLIADSPFLLNTNLDNFICQTPVQFSGVIFDCAAAIRIGGFDEKLVHINDRDMWLRLSLNANWIHINKVLSNYRIFDGNDTSKLIKTGKNISDCYAFFIKHQKNLNISKSYINDILFKMFLKQSIFLKGSDYRSNVLVIKSLIGNYYYYLKFNHTLKKLIRKFLFYNKFK